MNTKPKAISGLRTTAAKGTNPKEVFGFAKLPMEMIPETAIVGMALAMKNGLKYGPYNYRKDPMQALTLLGANKRHVSALLDGEDFDPATGIPHAFFAMTTIAIYVDCWLRGTLIDNRPLPGVAGELIALFSNVPGAPEKTPRELQESIEQFIAARQQAVTTLKALKKVTRGGKHAKR